MQIVLRNGVSLTHKLKIMRFKSCGAVHGGKQEPPRSDGTSGAHLTHLEE